MRNPETFTLSIEPSAEFTSKMKKITRLLRQLPEAVLREMFGDADRLVLKLGSCDFGPAIHARVGHRVHRFTFSGVDEVLASARRAHKRFCHG